MENTTWINVLDKGKNKKRSPKVKGMNSNITVIVIVGTGAGGGGSNDIKPIKIPLKISKGKRGLIKK